MFLKRLGIGKGKKSGYFLEAPAALSEAASDAKAALSEAASDAKATLSEAASDAKAALAKPDELLKAVKEAVTPADESTSNGAAASKQKKFKKVQSKSEDAKSDAKPQTAASSAAPVAPKPIVAPAPAAPATANFATEHLLPKNTPRRRPGPSLNMFKDMAKQVSPRR